ncbi:MAG: tetratricopeptide repeat protein [Methanotrichaceae archaeon]|nr:tetratricopeptide repeat protein [Methanotrichaceae archaeon]
MRYQVMYYNSFGDMEWEPTGAETNDLEKAIAKRDRLNATLDKDAFECGDHYGVINLDSGLEEQCSLDKLRSEAEATLWDDKAHALYDQGKYDEAIRAYDKAIKLDPNHADAWNNKGNAFFNLNKYDKAISAYDKAIGLDPVKARSWFNKGNALKIIGKYNHAIEAYDKALQLDPKLAEALHNRDETLKLIGRKT